MHYFSIVNLSRAIFLLCQRPKQSYKTKLSFRHGCFYIPIEKIPQHTINALLSTEDRRFYDHWGINVRRIPKVVVVNLMSMRFREGFSTITMQLARNLYFGFKKTISRKLREIITAIQIERTYSKQEILEMYLPKILSRGMTRFMRIYP